MFASSWGAMEWQDRLKHYFESFEPETKKAPEEDYDVDEFEPQSQSDVEQMVNAARRLGVVS